MQAAALSLKIQRADVVAINAELLHIEFAAGKSELVDTSALAALREGNGEIEQATQTIETSSDAATVAKAVEQRAEVTAHRVMTAGNFGRAAILAVQKGTISGIEKGTEGVVSGGIKTGAAILAGAVAGPFVALGQFVSSLVPLGKKAKDASEKIDDPTTIV